MKIKVFPEDFQVVEKITIKTQPEGKYSIYRLEKRNWATLDLIDYLKRKHRLATIRYAGLKDRYASTTQYVSIIGEGPPKIIEENFSLTFIGKSEHPEQHPSTQTASETRKPRLGGMFDTMAPSNSTRS